MPSILLINPRGHGAYKPNSTSVKKGRKARRKAKRQSKSTTGAPKMAKAKRKTKKRKSAAKTAHRKTRRKYKSVAARKAARRSRRKALNTRPGYYPNPARAHRKHRRSRRRHNPIGGMLGKIPGTSMLMPAATGAVGAVALDIAWAYLPIPDTWKQGNHMPYAVKAVGAVGLTWALGKVVSKQKAQMAGVGMLTVIGYQWLHNLIATNFSTLKLNGMDYYSPGPVSGLSAFQQPMLSAFDSSGNMGEMNAYMNEYDYADQSGGKY